MPPMRLATTLSTVALGLLLTACNSSPSGNAKADPDVPTGAAAKPPVPATSAAAAPTTAAASASPAGDTTTASLTASPSASAAAAPAPKDIPAPADVAAPPKDAQKTASGLVSKVISKGTGKAHPKATEQVKVHYTGWTKDGKMFDSSVTRGEPLTFPLDKVIKGWTEGLQLMVVGEKRRLWIPGALAYGDHPRMGAPAGDLVFDVELLDIPVPPKPAPVPPDVKAPPASATKTGSGLAYRIIKSGTGGKSPKASDRVTVNYTGWTTDGKMFDSSANSGEPASFGLSQVIKGWTEGLQLMKVGDTARFWIPANLAYGESPRPGAPAGMLVFDVELLSIP
jgi:peptidylprolyl isomerase